MSYLEKVISGGQIGIDIAALRAAKRAGIKTGGCAPKGFKTKNGPNPTLGTEYGIVEMPTEKYPPRTFANVQAANATLILASNFMSPGIKCTSKAIKKIGKPAVGVVIKSTPQGTAFSHSSEDIAKLLTEENIKILNVAGNSDITLELVAEEWLYQLFTYEAENGNNSERP